MPEPTRDLSGPTADPSPADATRSTGSRTDGLPATPAATEMPVAPPGYELRDEVGSGGMGVVYRARDLRLNRDVAVKLLQDKYAPTSLAARRFIDESQITGQLQHPGIPPVHEVGTLPDGRPYLVMKLIKGQTLAEMLPSGGRRFTGDSRPPRGAGPQPSGGRESPVVSRGTLIASFEQVCQAVAYAHNHGVIHRDLKPHNVMVGQFGEVQVMDWGLAKFRTDTRAETPETETATTFHDPRHDTDESLKTRPGSFLGTPAYMPPEQALGAVDQIDEQSDVFGLGAILCVILTGQPPFVAGSREATRQMAGEKKLAPAFARLDASSAEPELVALCKRCLSPEKSDRPRNAGEVAIAVHDFRVEAEERARQAELDRVRAEGERAKAELHAAEQRKRRKAQLALAGAVLVLAAGGGAFAWWQDRQATARWIETVNRERDEQDRRTRTGDAVAAFLSQCEDALRAEDAGTAGLANGAAQKTSAEGGADHLADRLARCQTDLAVLRDLDAADQFRWTAVGGFAYPDMKQVAARLRTAFQRFGVVPGTTPREEAGRLVAASLVRDRLVAALDLLMYAGYPDHTADIRAILRAADPHPYRDAMRDVFLVGGKDVDKLAKLAAQDEAGVQPPGFTAVYLGIAPLQGPVDAALQRRRQLLTTALRRSPGNLALIMTLGGMHPIEPRRGPAKPVHPLWLTTVEEAVPLAAGDGVEARVRWYGAGVAAHPRNAAARINLGIALLTKRDLDEGIAEFREAIRLAPTLSAAHNNLGIALQQKNDPDGAITAFREAIQLDPNDSAPHTNLGIVLQATGNLNGAIDEFREAIRLDPRSHAAHSSLGTALWLKGDPDGAIPVIQQAIQIDRTHARDFVGLSMCLRKKGDLGGAIVALEEAIRLDPKIPAGIQQGVDIMKKLKAIEDAEQGRIAPPPREVKRPSP